MKIKKLLSIIIAFCTTAFGVFPLLSISAESDDGIIRESLTSQELVNDMGFGWNLGDTLDVCNADRDGDGKIDENSETVDETLWGNPKATQELFCQLKSDGIKSVRIPVTWRDHLGEAPEYKVDESWMDRVQEVVDYARNAGMYVIINVHHDGGGDPEFGAWIRSASTDYDSFIVKYKALWSQIAERFKDYSDYLIFESMNEVGFDDLYNSNKTEAYDLLNRINQEFVNLVRESGGNNVKRHLLIAGYWTDITQTCSDYFKMPDDPENRCILSVHYYTPWQFCTTNLQSTWGTTSEVNQMKRLIKKLDTSFVSRGTPVIIGEYAASGSDLDSCILFIKTLNELCHGYGIATFLWDNGGQVDRNTYKWRTPELLQAIKDGNADSEDPSASASSSATNTSDNQTSLAKTSPTTSDKAVIKAPSVKKAKLKRVKKTKKKKQLKITWKKINKANGYQIKASLSKKFKKAKKYNTVVKTIKKNKSSAALKLKKSNKIYYVKIRAYKTYINADGKTKKAYGAFSKVKCAKTK